MNGGSNSSNLTGREHFEMAFKVAYKTCDTIYDKLNQLNIDYCTSSRRGYGFFRLLFSLYGKTRSKLLPQTIITMRFKKKKK